MRLASGLLTIVALLTPAPSIAAGPSTSPVELQLDAAASLGDVLAELAPALERATGVRATLNLAGSSSLARQIVAAGKADLFFSADEAWMDELAAKGLVDSASRCSPLSNRLVVVVARESPLELRSAADLSRPEVRHLALAEPEAVPAGRYAKAWLERSGGWSAVADRVVPTLDVRAALAAVEAGAAEAAVVYGTDAARSQRARVAFQVPEAEGPPISYALAAMAGRPHLELARHAVAWLCGPEAAAVFARHGFVVRPTSP